MLNYLFLQQPTEIPTWLPLKPHPKKKTKLCMIYPSATEVIYKESIIRHHLFCRAALVLHFGQTSFWHIKRNYTWGIFKLDQFPNSSNHTDTEHSCTSNTEGVGWWQAALSSSDKFQHKSCTLKNKHQEMTGLAMLILFLVRYVEKSEQGRYGYKKTQNKNSPNPSKGLPNWSQLFSTSYPPYSLIAPLRVSTGAETVVHSGSQCGSFLPNQSRDAQFATIEFCFQHAFQYLAHSYYCFMWHKQLYCQCGT